MLIAPCFCWLYPQLPPWRPHQRRWRWRRPWWIARWGNSIPISRIEGGTFQVGELVRMLPFINLITLIFMSILFAFNSPGWRSAEDGFDDISTELWNGSNNRIGLSRQIWHMINRMMFGVPCVSFGGVITTNIGDLRQRDRGLPLDMESKQTLLLGHLICSWFTDPQSQSFVGGFPSSNVLKSCSSRFFITTSPPLKVLFPSLFDPSSESQLSTVYCPKISSPVIYHCWIFYYSKSPIFRRSFHQFLWDSNLFHPAARWCSHFLSVCLRMSEVQMVFILFFIQHRWVPRKTWGFSCAPRGSSCRVPRPKRQGFDGKILETHRKILGTQQNLRTFYGGFNGKP